jgi:hypothetical protein
MIHKRQNLVAFAVAALVHAGLAGVLLTQSGTFPATGESSRLNVRLTPPREREPLPRMLASLPQPAPEPTPPPQPPPPAPAKTPQPSPEPTPTPSAGDIPDDLRQELARERDQLRAQLESDRKDALAMASDAARNAMARNNTGLTVGSGPVGTIRELDFSGWPQAVVDEIMARYNFRIVMKHVPAGSNQSFLSSAESAGGDVYYADRNHRGGYHEVFELSRKSVALMSKLEEDEIRKRNLDLSRTRVKRVKFGIVRTAPGKHDIGVLEFSAEPVP